MIAKNEATIKAILDAGFSHIKLELEGQLHREGDRDFGSTEYCESFIRDHLSESSLGLINYMRFYRDGSVDSELTFTIPTQHVEIALEVIGAWNELVRAIGNGCDVRGAGMHFSVLTRPLYPSNEPLNSVKLENFTNEVSKLLPALYIAATSGNFTRALTYRSPQISHSMKRTAIYTHNGTCLEYRIFETCYERPEAIYEFLGVIARTLEFYADPTKRVASLNKQFHIYQDEHLNGFTSLPEQVSILKKQFKHLKPHGMTLRDFMEIRGVKLLVKEANMRQAAKIVKLKKLYQEHRAAQLKLREYSYNQYELDNLEYWKITEPDMNDEWYRHKITGTRLEPLEDEKTYISNNLRTDRPIASLYV